MGSLAPARTGRRSAAAHPGEPEPGTAVVVSRCRTCGGRTARGYSLCMSCRAVAVGLGRALVPVTAVRVVGPGSGLYRALRQYKSGEPEVARRQQRRLAAVLDAFCARHLATVAPADLDATVVVPSGRGGRPPPHPLAAVVRATTHLPPVLDALTAAGGTPGHRRPLIDAYRAARVAGLGVLLVDDVYASGAHLQSAAAALLDAGAASVVGLVLGRYDRPYSDC